MPRARLLLWVTLLVLPFSFVAAVTHQAAWLSAGVLLLFLALVGIDALLARRQLAGIAVLLPEVIRTSAERQVAIEMSVRNEHLKPRTVRFGLPLPPGLASPLDDVWLSLPQGTEWSRFAWSCSARTRGSYRLDAIHLEGTSGLGFWGARKALPVSTEIRVYPNLRNDRKQLASLFLHRGTFGLHSQRQVGKGREFEKLRDYIPGDSYEDVHWKATAKRGKPVTKVFQIERTQEVYVVIDSSRLSARNAAASVQNASSAETAEPQPGPAQAASPTILDRYINAALSLALAAEQQGDLFGLLHFASRVDGFSRARNGQAHYSACRDALYTLKPQPVSPDYDELATFIRLRLRRRALLLFLTSLDDPVLAESFVRNAELLRRRHLLFAGMLQPPGVHPLFSNPAVSTVDELYAELGAHLMWHNLRELEKVLQRRGVHFSLFKNERLSAQLVSQYLNIKKRQLL